MEKDKEYREAIEKARRQRRKIMAFLEYVDAEKNALFTKREQKLLPA